MNFLALIKLRSFREWTSTFPVFLLLLAVIIAGNGELIHARVLNIGEFLWQDYFVLRADIATPNCQLDLDIDAELAKLETKGNELGELEGLFEAEPFDRIATRKSLQSAQLLCQQKHLLAKQNQARITPAVVMFRTLETGVAGVSLFAFEKQRWLLILTIFISALTCTVKQRARRTRFLPCLIMLTELAG